MRAKKARWAVKMMQSCGLRSNNCRRKASTRVAHYPLTACSTVALCTYHDQALIPIKTLAFDNAVNVTLGLPLVRTSPDHGTAFDIAGSGGADPSSLIAALRLAARLSEQAAAAAAAGA